MCPSGRGATMGRSPGPPPSGRPACRRAPLVREIPYADPVDALRGRRGRPRTPCCSTAPTPTRAGAARSSALEPFRVLVCRDGVATIDGVRRAGRALRGRPAPSWRAIPPRRVPGRGRSAAGRSATSATSWPATWSTCRCRRPTRTTSPRCSCCFCDVVVPSTTASAAPSSSRAGYPETDPARPPGPRRRAPAQHAVRPSARGAGRPARPPRRPRRRASASDVTRGRLRDGRAAGDRLHPRRRRLPGQPLPALRGRACRTGSAPLDLFRRLQRRQPGALRRPTSSSTTW